MRITIFGAGAIGGYLAAKLAAAGRVNLSIVARGEHLAAIRETGLRLAEAGRESAHKVRATADPLELGVQDYVVLSLKAHSVASILDQIAPLIGEQTAVVTMQNGVPWWYFYGLKGPFEATRLASVDPGGMIWDQIGPQRVIGAVVYPAAEVEAPGLIRHLDGTRFSLGEPSGEITPDVQRLADLFVAAGLKAPVLDRIRDEDVSDKELSDAKTYLTGIFPIRLETQEGLVDQLVQIRMHDLAPDYLQTYRENIQRVTKEDLRRAALRSVTPDRAAVVVVGDGAQIREQVAPYVARVEEFVGARGGAAGA